MPLKCILELEVCPNCSEGLIQRLLMEDSAQAWNLGPSDPNDYTEEEAETSKLEEEWAMQGRNRNEKET